MENQLLKHFVAETYNFIFQKTQNNYYRLTKILQKTDENIRALN